MIRRILQRIFSLERTSKRTLQMIADIFLIIASYIAAMNLRLDGFHYASNPKAWFILPVVVPITLIAFYKLRLYRNVVRYLSTNIVYSVALSVTISAITMLLVSQLFRWPVPRSVPFIYMILLFLCIVGVRFTLRFIHHHQYRYNRRPVAIYGAGDAGRQLLHALRFSPEYKPVFFIDDDPALDRIYVAGLLTYSFKKARQELKKQKISMILLAIPSMQRSVRKNIISQLAEFPVEVKTLPGIVDIIKDSKQMPQLRSVTIEELLGRDPVPPIKELMEQNIRNKIVLVSGAGGSIGSELCRQIVMLSPSALLLLDVSEFALYSIHEELLNTVKTCNIDCRITPLICSVQNKQRLLQIMESCQVNTIFHAAAYKHVPMVEYNVVEGILNNVFGTRNLVECSVESGVDNFILISTDKAVRPTNFMGASKRLAELVLQAHATNQNKTLFSSVRFGNVLGSSGSVIPRFEKQIKEGGPVTVTHKEIQRYFMTISEAAQLVIQASSMAKGGDVFVLDMGKPVNILELAQNMICLHGLLPYIEDGTSSQVGDIPIHLTGLRPGEKLYEELLIGNNPVSTKHPRIMTATEKSLSMAELDDLLGKISSATRNHDVQRIHDLLVAAPLDFVPLDVSIHDIVWENMNKSADELVDRELQHSGDLPHWVNSQ